MASYNGHEFELGVRNLSALVVNFQKTASAIESDIKALVRVSSEELRELTEFLAAKDTGYMSEHVREYTTGGGYGFEVGWDASDFFDAGLAFYPWFVEFGTRRMAAQPALGPAADQIFPKHRDGVADLIRRNVDRIGDL